MNDNTKTALITGATSGIGLIVAEHLVKRGYELFILGRTPEKLNQTNNYLHDANPLAIIHIIDCDLSSFKSIKNACDELKSLSSAFDLIILNAGLWNFKFIETRDGIEETLQVNLISPFMIFNQIKDLIPKNGESKVIFTSSGLHQGIINFEDLEYRGNFSGFKVYRQSKLGVLMLTRWLAKQTKYSGISFYCVHPGMVNTQLGRNAGWFSRSIFKLFGKSKRKGAKTHIFLIDTNNNDLRSGQYYANCVETKTTAYSYKMEESEKLINALTEFL